MACSQEEDLSSTFIDALISSACSEVRLVAAAFPEAFQISTETILSIRSDMPSQYDSLAGKLAHSCYAAEWHIKCGGCLGIGILTNYFPVPWLINHHVEFLRGLMFILKDLTPENGVVIVDEAMSSLEDLIKKCHTNQATSVIST